MNIERNKNFLNAALIVSIVSIISNASIAMENKQPIQQKTLPKDEILKELDKSLRTLPQSSYMPQDQQQKLSKEELSKILKGSLNKSPQGTNTPDSKQKQSLLPPSNFQGILLPLTDFPEFADRSSYASFETSMIVRITKSNNPEIKVGDLVHFDPELAQSNSKPLSLQKLKQATIGQTIAFDNLDEPIALEYGKAKIRDIENVKGFSQREELSDYESLNKIKDRALAQGTSISENSSEQKIIIGGEMIERIPQQERKIISNKTGQSTQEKTQMISEQRPARELTSDEISRRSDEFLEALQRNNPGLEFSKYRIKAEILKNSLGLSDEKIRKIPPEIGLLTNLKSLYISIDQHKNIDLSPEIYNLVNLTSLTLTRSTLTELPIGIEKLQNLVKLDISYNNLTELPIGIEKLQNLTYLDANHNKLIDLPAELEKLPKLSTLNVGANDFSNFPITILNILPLKELILYYSQIKHLPAEISKLRELEYLNLHGNWKMNNLPVEIGQLLNLKRLRISGCHLKQIPSEIGNLQTLTHLYLDDNELTSLPSEVEKLINLNELDLTHNELKFLPREIINLTKLKLLEVGRNPLLDSSDKGLGTSDLISIFGELVKGDDGKPLKRPNRWDDM